MAVNMSNVKQIMHNNKEVIKIEDSSGHIIWQKAQPKRYLYKVSITYKGSTWVYDTKGNRKTLTATMYSETPLNRTDASWDAFTTDLINAGLISDATPYAFNLLSFVDDPSTGYCSSKGNAIYQFTSTYVKYWVGGLHPTVQTYNANHKFDYKSELVEIDADTLWFGAVNQRDGTYIDYTGWAARIYSTDLGHTFNFATDYKKLEVTNMINMYGYLDGDPTQYSIISYSSSDNGTYTFKRPQYTTEYPKTNVNYTSTQHQVVELHPFTI